MIIDRYFYKCYALLSLDACPHLSEPESNSSKNFCKRKHIPQEIELDFYTANNWFVQIVTKMTSHNLD